MLVSLSTFVRQNIDAKQYFESVFDNIRWPGGTSEARVDCCFHGDRNTPSLSLNPTTGAWYCHGCEAGGTSIVSFHTQYNECEPRVAAEQLYEQFIHPVVPSEKIEEWQKRLAKTPSAISYLKKRHLSLEFVTQQRIGFDGERITFPIFNEFDLCVNVKQCDPTSGLKKAAGAKFVPPKMLNYQEEGETRSYGSPVMLYPLSSFELAREKKYIVICEGEFDMGVLRSMDIPAVTSTGGSKGWPAQYNEMFRGLNVIVAYDNDKDGTKYDKLVLKHLSKLAKTIKRLDIPKKYGKDVSDWADKDTKMRSRAGWKKQFEAAKLLVENDDETISKTEGLEVGLYEASEAQHFGKKIVVDALVSGKQTAPYMLPQIYRVTCDQSCEECPLATAGQEFREKRIDPTDPSVLRLVDEPRAVVDKTLLRMAGFDPKPDCHAKIDVVKAFNLEGLAVIPTIGSSGQYCQRTAYFVGHGLKSNHAYRFEGLTVPNPKDQQSVHLFSEAKPAQDEIDTFKLTPEMREKLTRFRPTKLNLKAHLNAIAEWQSRHVTKIKQREDLHTAVDLVFHSVRGFDFNGERVSRGMLDVLVLGDTRCGKGYVTEGLSRYYGLGSVAPGENCSFAGLIGGVAQLGTKRWLVQWGVIPLNNDRLVIIDEASSLSHEDFAKMSRVRSEGVAEITKIAREVTQANARLIWLANPRSGREIKTYNYGVHAIKELIGNNEDISRFDFAMTVAANEVSPDIINSQVDYNLTDADKYPRDLWRTLVLWAWSRRPDQVKFSKRATTAVIEAAIKFGHTYSSTIPLVQAENIRIKIAKVAAAIAARTFSSDEKGERLLVKEAHVKMACDFLRDIYAKPSMSYDQFSKSSLKSVTMENPEELDKIADQLGEDGPRIIEGIKELHLIDDDTLMDYTGDREMAKTIIGELVRVRALKRLDKAKAYLKNPAFTKWAKDWLRAKERNENPVSDDGEAD